MGKCTQQMATALHADQALQMDAPRLAQEMITQQQPDFALF